MNCHNSEEFLEEAIESVLFQTYDNWELIIWDNISEDNTKNIATKYKDSRIKYFLSNQYAPLGQARNLAIEQAKGKLIAFLDSDDIWLPNKLKKQIPLFNDEDVGIVICDTVFFNNNKEKQLYYNNKPPTGFVFKELLSNYFISLETAIIRYKALQTLDYWFDTRFNVIEEYDLFVRIGYAWKLDYVDEILAKWRVHESSLTWRKSELFPKEKKLMLKSLLKIDASINKNYSKEIRDVHRNIALEEAQILWSSNNNKLARKKIEPFIYDSFKYRLFFSLTFFPYSLYNYIQKLRGAVRPN